VAFGGRHYVRRPTVKSLLEATGYSTAGNLGALVAANTTTIGGIAAGAIPLNRLASTAAASTVKGKVNGVFDVRRQSLPGTPPPRGSSAPPAPRRAAFDVEY
jgi:hypothetical protein